MGCVRGHIMRVPMQCARRRAYMLRAPRSSYVHPDAAVDVYCGRGIRAIWTPGEVLDFLRCIGQKNQEGYCHDEYIHPSIMSAREALDINAFELLWHLYSRIARRA